MKDNGTVNLSYQNLKSINFSTNSIRNAKEISLNFIQIRYLEERFLDSPKLEKLSLSYNHLESFELEAVENLSNLKFLDLSNNFISRFLSHCDKFKSVVSLNLYNNRLTTVDSHHFREFTNLKTLNMSKNRIVRINPNAFSKLNNLKELDLSKNFLNGYFNVSFISQAHNLKFLDLSENSFMNIKPYFLNKLQSLETLRLDHNTLRAIKKFSFYGLKKLEYLDLSSNKISIIESNSFYGLSSLKRLKLNSNRLKILDNSDVFNSIDLSVEYLNLNKNLLVKISAVKKFKSLIELHLYNNQIDTDMNLKSSPQFEVLDLGKQFLNKENLKKILTDNIKVKSLYLNNNLFTSIDTDSFKEIEMLKFLDLHNNKIHMLPLKLIESLNDLTYLDLSNNLFEYFEQHNYSDDHEGLQEQYDIVISKNNSSLTHLKLNDNLIVDLDLLYLNTSVFATLKELDLCVNFIETIRLIKLELLESLKLCKNRIKEINENSFLSLKNLKYLDLSENNISSLNFLFGTYTSLNLSFNSIEVITPGSFKNLTSLTSLDLNGNIIEIIELNTFEGLNNLVFLSIENNYLKIIASNSLSSLHLLETLNLNNNEIFYIEHLPKSIKKLLLSKNKIETIDWIDSLLSLTYLDVSFNEIEQASLASILSNSNLEDIFLNHNLKLTSLDLSNIEKFPKLKLISLFSTNIESIYEGKRNSNQIINILGMKSNEEEYESFLTTIRNIKIKNFVYILT